MDLLAAAPSTRAGMQMQLSIIPAAPNALSTYLWRGSFTPSLGSIPEATEQDDKRRAAKYAASNNVQLASNAETAEQLIADSVLAASPLTKQQWHDQPQRQQQQEGQQQQPVFQHASSSGSEALNVPIAGQSSTNDSDSDSDSSRSGSNDIATALDSAEVDLSAVVASAWAINVRHFTDCVPISADSICSTSTCHSPSFGRIASYLEPKQLRPALQALQEHAGQHRQHWQHQQPRKQQFLHTRRHEPACDAAAEAAGPSGSLPNSNSSGSFIHASPSGSADDCSNAALQASLLSALQELDDLEWCPWDRVSKWLETQAAASSNASSTALVPAASAALGEARSTTDSSSLRSPHTVDQQLDLQLQAKQQQQSKHHKCKHQPNILDVAAGKDGEAVFDAPAWWQEAVLARLQEQREAYNGSWWSKAKVLASLAAQKCQAALQI